jgi:hypothetical protein
MLKTPAWEADVLPLNYARNFNDLDASAAIPCVKLSSTEVMTQRHNLKFNQYLGP